MTLSVKEFMRQREEDLSAIGQEDYLIHVFSRDTPKLGQKIQMCRAMRRRVFTSELQMPYEFDCDGYDAAREVFHLAAILKEKHDLFLGAVRGRVISSDTVELASLSVLHGCRHINIGHKLLARFEEHTICVVGAQKIVAYIPTTFKSAMSFFRNRRFAPTSSNVVRKNGVNCYMFEKALT